MSLTSQIITAVIIGLGIYDLIVVLRTGVSTSISRVMQRAGLRSPLVVFTVGFVCGHVFGYMPPEDEKHRSVEEMKWQPLFQHKSGRSLISESSGTSQGQQGQVSP